MAQSGTPAEGFQSNAPQSINGWQSDYVEALLTQYRANPDSVSAEWKQFFMGFELGCAREGFELGRAREGFELGRAREGTTVGATPANQIATQPVMQTIVQTVIQGLDPDQRKVDELVHRYRTYGHLAATLDPLGTVRPFPEQLTLEALGLDDDALGRAFDPGTLPLDNPSPLSDIVSCLEETYCGTFAVEYMHLQCAQRRAWIAKRIESARNRPHFSAETKKRILSKLMDADSFEHFLATRFVGKKAARVSFQFLMRSSKQDQHSARKSSRSAWRIAVDSMCSQTSLAKISSASSLSLTKHGRRRLPVVVAMSSITRVTRTITSHRRDSVFELCWPQILRTLSS